MKSLDFGSYTLKLCLGFTLAATVPQYTSAHLVPGAKYCSSFDTQQTLESEKLDLSNELPKEYRKFEIVLFHDRLLRVIVPANAGTALEGSLQSQRVVDIWGNVLAAHHDGCAVGVYGVQFVTGSGKMLFQMFVTV